MLERLSIQDFLLIDRLDLDFSKGLTVLTGETGAGKSIILDAVGLVLGQRADLQMIREGRDSAVITALFSIKDSDAVRDFLKQHDLPEVEDDVLIIKRVLAREGSSRIFINDQVVTLQLLRQFRVILVDICGQFDSIGESSTHKAILDSFAKSDELKGLVKEHFLLWKKANDQLQELIQSLMDRDKNSGYLAHVVDELKALNPKQGEEELLLQERVILQQSEKMVQAFCDAKDAFLKPSNILTQLVQAERALLRLPDVMQEKVGGALESIGKAIVEVQESFEQIERFDVSNDGDKLEKLEERLFELRAAARKHNCHIDDLEKLRDDFVAKLEMLEKGEENVEALKILENKAKQDFLKYANQLHDLRCENASDLEQKVMAELVPLKLDKTQFKVALSELDESSWTSQGIDHVEFLISTNPGTPLGPLSKVASGGEYSRLLLALKVVLAKGSTLPTIIFDEVDRGVGGAVAAAVGERLVKLSHDVQIFVITHSPQVAAKGDYHLKVEKDQTGAITKTNVFYLDENARLEEVARMLSGEVITDAARTAANDLFDKKRLKA